MTNILESMMAQRNSFSPQTVDEYFALQLARKLNDIASLNKYVSLCSHLALDEILRAYALAGNHTGLKALAEFDDQITKLIKRADDFSL